jgi:hypothetical protein
MQAELARERTRSHLEISSQLKASRQLKALKRARRVERKAERRLLEAWQARSALEENLGIAE